MSIVTTPAIDASFPPIETFPTIRRARGYPSAYPTESVASPVFRFACEHRVVAHRVALLDVANLDDTSAQRDDALRLYRTSRAAAHSIEENPGTDQVASDLPASRKSGTVVGVDERRLDREPLQRGLRTFPPVTPSTHRPTRRNEVREDTFRRMLRRQRGELVQPPATRRPPDSSPCRSRGATAHPFA